MKNRWVKWLIVFVVLVAAIPLAGYAFAADSNHTESSRIEFEVSPYSYYAYSGATSFNTGSFRGEANIGATTTVPLGYMGARPFIYDSNENCIYAGTYYYNTTVTSGPIMSTGSVNVAQGFYYSQGRVRIYGPNGYEEKACIATPYLMGGTWSSRSVEDAQLMTETEIAIEMEKSKSPNYYPTNANGQTYGSALFAYSAEYMPDLIAAVGTNGREGYILRSDEQAAVDLTLEEVLSGAGNEDVTIPLYESDGKTVIGEFVIHAAQGAGA